MVAIRYRHYRNVSVTNFCNALKRSFVLRNGLDPGASKTGQATMPVWAEALPRAKSWRKHPERSVYHVGPVECD
jgi:hypothetical protein